MGLFTKTCFNILNFILKFPIYSNKLRNFWTAHVSFLKFCKSLWTKKEIGIKCKFKCVFYSNLFNVPCDFVYNLHGFILNINVTSCKASSYFLEPEIICQKKHIFQFFFGNRANLGHTFTVSKKSFTHPFSNEV